MDCLVIKHNNAFTNASINASIDVGANACATGMRRAVVCPIAPCDEGCV